MIGVPNGLGSAALHVVPLASAVGPRASAQSIALAHVARKHCVVTKPQHRADVFIDPDLDPRGAGTSRGDERATLVECLRCQRLTLQLKCEGLDAEQLASTQLFRVVPQGGISDRLSTLPLAPIGVQRLSTAG